ncbi:hypothetical protein HELRODRAFT_194482 [Helobdella robusta]|uniref:Alpha-1,4-N-acetylglucosaminyltransferase n=1 Tax=Helobdella robusta TaxID=6412 RepID=T1FW39_HELRO|nr:hypothetical protein HELRODRAFT_194482 [Helobdella robusta]ESN91926.1 hypothetical protein HELRODRAFT_194482 [Helobdella robusta]
MPSISISKKQKTWCLQVLAAFNIVFCLYNVLTHDHANSSLSVNSSYRDLEPASDDKYEVPNIVHFIWYATESLPLNFNHMLSILSAHKILQPSHIFFHTNNPPVGKYWEAVLKLDNFVVNMRQPPTTLFNETVKPPQFYTSHSNVDRVKVLMEVGGIYLDLDVIVTRPFDDLRKYPCTIGKEQDDQACGSVIVCSKHSTFLLLWINSFLDDYRIDVWAYNSGKVPYNLARRFPHLVHLDENKLNRPNFDELDVIWGEGRFDWRSNYAVHTWYRLWKSQSPFYHGVEPNEVNIKTWNSSFGEMARSVLYGGSKMMDSDLVVL